MKRGEVSGIDQMAAWLYSDPFMNIDESGLGAPFIPNFHVVFIGLNIQLLNSAFFLWLG
jgi:hypothetical protein